MSEFPDTIRDTADLTQAYLVSVDVESDQADIYVGKHLIGRITILNGVAKLWLNNYSVYTRFTFQVAEENEVIVSARKRRVSECNTCGDSGRWETTTEDSPSALVDLGPCPDCEGPGR